MMPKMKCITVQQANAYLNHIDMEIGDWNQIADTTGFQQDKSFWINYRAPDNSHELLKFSQHVAGWLPIGDWKIFQIDNSSVWIDPVQTSLISGLLFGMENVSWLAKNRTFLFEFGKDENTDSSTELLISNLIFTFLLFECHGYVVSSNSNVGQRLGIQDGFVYFSSKEKNLSGAENLLKNFERHPLKAPQWVLDIIAKRQEQALKKI